MSSKVVIKNCHQKLPKTIVDHCTRIWGKPSMVNGESVKKQWSVAANCEKISSLKGRAGQASKFSSPVLPFARQKDKKDKRILFKYLRFKLSKQDEQVFKEKWGVARSGQAGFTNPWHSNSVCCLCHNFIWKRGLLISWEPIFNVNVKSVFAEDLGLFLFIRKSGWERLVSSDWRGHRLAKERVG